MMADVRALAAGHEQWCGAAIAFVEAHGPVRPGDVVAHLRSTGHDVERDDLVDELVDLHGCWWLTDRLLRPSQVLEGRVLTHRVTGQEASGGRLLMSPDLELLSLEEVPYYESPLGPFAYEVDARGAWLRGPEGWIDAHDQGALVTVGWQGAGSIDFDLAPAVSDGAEDAAALRSAFEEQAHDGTALLHDVLVAAILLDDRTFRRAAPPLSDLLDRAGLSLRGDEVAAQGYDWETHFSRRRDEYVSSLADQHGLDRRAADHLATLALASVTFADHEPGDLAGCVEAFGDPDATAAFLEPVTSRLAEDIEHLRAFAERVLQLAERPPVGALLALARAAELDGDGHAHGRFVEEALQRDPRFWAALEDRAWVRSDRGAARIAANDLEQVSGSGDRLLLVLDRYSAPGPSATGRNDSCPCGSGRKHKRCCGPTNGYRLSDRASWLYEKAMWFASRPGQAEGMRHLMDKALDGHDDVPLDLFEGHVALHHLALFEHGLVRRFVDERGSLLPPDERELAESWIGVPSRLLRVAERVAPDQVALEDLRSGETLVVRLHAVDDSLLAGSLLIAPALPDGVGPSLLGWVQIADESADVLLAGLDEFGLLAAVRADVLARWEAGSTLLEEMGTERDERSAWLFPTADAGDRMDGSLTEMMAAEHAGLTSAGDAFHAPDMDLGAHLVLHEVVANQIVEDDPPEVWLTSLRLSAHGYPRHEVLHMLAAVVADQIHAGLTASTPNDRAGHIASLDELPDTWEAARLERHDRQTWKVTRRRRRGH